MQIRLGQKVKDLITGFEGTVIARTEWLNGCIRLVVQPKCDKDGKIPDAQTIDEPQVEILGEGYPKERKTDVGGPIPNPQRQPDAQRR